MLEDGAPAVFSLGLGKGSGLSGLVPDSRELTGSIKQTSTIEGAVEVSVNREICIMILTVFEGIYDFGQER
ncbi:hypothetical protein C4D60_Mb05t30780 [Musa balbisiana]|uniref:Uncharacterized protein n=1 Tax=Musa balbisiana TaxID=52838 RepID=A0A4V4H8J9_MUSBA|nr:hypothetical protein C4D60_Mb05t30780 [Musa balbisiana]